MDGNPVYAHEALRKLHLAQGLGTAVYLYGATGFGKSALLRHFTGDVDPVWINCRHYQPDLLDHLQAVEGGVLVIDDLQNLDDPTARACVINLVRGGKCWVAMIGRMSLPAWLAPLLLNTQLIVIPEDDLRLGQAEIAQMSQNDGLNITAEDIAYIREVTEGNVMAISLTLKQLADGNTVGPELVQRVKKVFMDYLEGFVIGQWDPDVRDFLLQVCVVDEFTIALAEAITGDDHSLMLAKKAAAYGNIYKA